MNLLTLLATSLITGQSWGEPQITLTPDMLLSETGLPEVQGLVDEQTATRNTPPTKPFFPGWTAWQYPLSVIVDLGTECQVSSAKIYNEGGGGPIAISTGIPFQWKKTDLSLTGYKSWNEYKIDAKTRFLRLTLTQPLNISELLVFGTPIGKAPSVKAKPAKLLPLPTMDQLVGTNAFIDDPIDKIAQPSSLVREYHNWGWDIEGPDALRRFQPSGAAGGKSWFFDDYYAKLKAQGAIVCPVIWQAARPLFDYKSLESKPIKPGADSGSPASYRLHAEHFFQVAARYGSRKVDDSLLVLAPDQPRKSGLGVLRYLENWNEPDKTWEGRESRFDPFELAAMSSADYDGDQGRMGKNIGVKAADPSMKLVAGGLTGLDLPYLRAMKFWADYNRKGNFPADVLNIHHYSSSNHEQWFQPGGKGISPEADDLAAKMRKLTQWRDANLPDRELWLTEFGYDTNPASPLHAPAMGSMSAEQVQAAWLIRAYMALAAAHVDRATMFMLRDTDSNGTGVFATCGLVTQKGSWQPKPSWFYQCTLKNQLKGYRFSQEVPSGNPSVRVYEFAKSKTKRALMVWCTTSEDKKVEDYKLPTGYIATKTVTFADKETNGKESPASNSITVSETPKIIFIK